MIWINKEKAAAMTNDELFKSRALLAGNLATDAVFRSDIMMDFDKTCMIQNIEDELQKRGAIEFKDRMF